MSYLDSPLPQRDSSALPALPRLGTPARALDSRLWALLTKPGPLTADEWAYVDAQERAGLQEAETDGEG